MKHIWLSLLFGLFTLNCLAQSDPDREIDFELNGQDLAEAILKLSKESGVNIAFSNSSLPQIPSIIYRAEQKAVIRILRDLLDGQGFEVRRLAKGLALIPYADIYSTYVVNGYVKNANTGERLVSAHVVDLESQKSVFTNEFGFFSLRLERGEKNLNFSYLGYSPNDHFIDLEEDRFVQIELIPSLELSEVVIYGREYWKVWEQSTNARNIPVEGLRSKPSIAGHADPIRYTHALAGVSTSADGIGGVSVRGANQQHNLFLLDGVKVYNPGHVNGLISIFDDQFISSARFYKTPGPARFQGALSSVFDIRTVEGNSRSFEAGADIDLISASVNFEGPIKKDKSSFLVGGRYSYLDRLIRGRDQEFRLRNGTEGQIDYGFYDVFFKSNFQIGERSDVYVSFYKGKDTYENTTVDRFVGTETEIESTERQQIDWGNTIGSVRWNNRFSSKIYARLTLMFSQYDQNFQDFLSVEDYELSTDNLLSRRQTSVEGISQIRDYGLQFDVDFIPSPAHSLRIGAQWVNHDFAPGVIVRQANGMELDPRDITLLEEQNESYEFDEIAAYIEDEINIKDRLKINAGVNLSLFPLGKRRDWQFNPRLNFDAKLTEGIHLYGNFSRASQYFHLLQTSSFGIPSDAWVPLTDNIHPQTSWVFGSSFNIFVGDNQFSPGVFYKQLDALLQLEEGSLTGIQGILNISDWEDRVTRGKGRSRGLEFEWMKSGKKLDWTMSYTFSESIRQYDELNLGREFFDNQDRPHKASAEFLYRWTKSFETSFSINYASGNPITFPSGEQLIVDPETGTIIRIPIILERNGFRLPEYFRADFAMKWKIPGNKVKQSLLIGVYNLTNHENPLFYRYIAQQGEELRFLKSSLLPISPSLRYSIRFQ